MAMLELKFLLEMLCYKCCSTSNADAHFFIRNQFIRKRLVVKENSGTTKGLANLE